GLAASPLLGGNNHALLRALALDRGPDDDLRAGCAGNRAFDHQQVLVGAHFDDAKVLRRARLRAHVSVHALALENTTRVRTAADRAGAAERLVRTVRGAVSAEVVALHDALETLALARAGHVDL